jgi:hypothetical protein
VNSTRMVGAGHSEARFTTTHWSAVCAAGRTGGTRARDALARLCQTYWNPLDAYVRGCTNQVDTSGDVSFRSRTTTDRVSVEDLALQMLVAIRQKDDTKLKALATDSVHSGWVDALPGYPLELRERFTQFTSKPFTMYPAESMVKDGRAVVKCTGPKELMGDYIVLFFVKSSKGRRNWLMGKSSPNTPLADHLKPMKRETKLQP